MITDIKTALEQEHSKAQNKRITDFVGNDPIRFAELMNLFLGDSYIITQRAAWAVSNCGLDHPLLLTPYHRQLLTKLKTPNQHDAITRNILRIWVKHMPPEDLWGELFDICYRLVRSKDEPGAIKAFSLYTLGNIAAAYPELAIEVRSLINDLTPIGTPAIIASGKKVLKQLNKR
jgi:hypothetical protein